MADPTTRHLSHLLPRSNLFLVNILLLALLSACLPIPTALPPIAQGAASTWAAETLQAQAPAKTLAAQFTADLLTRLAPTLSPTSAPTRPSVTPSPSFTPPISLLSLTPQQPTLFPTDALPTVVAQVDTNCRLRPSPNEQRLAILESGQQATVYGRNTDSSWWYIANPELPGEFCWVWAGSVTLSGETAALPIITPAPPPKTVDFEATFSNVHFCYYDKYIIFRVENTGTETLYVATITIISKGEELFSDILWAPYMWDANDCPPGRYPLEAGKSGFIYIKKVDGIKPGMRLRALIKICTEDKPDKICVEKEVAFQF